MKFRPLHDRVVVKRIDAEFDFFGRHNDLRFQLFRSERPRNWASLQEWDLNLGA